MAIWLLIILVPIFIGTFLFAIDLFVSDKDSGSAFAASIVLFFILIFVSIFAFSENPYLNSFKFLSFIFLISSIIALIISVASKEKNVLFVALFLFVIFIILHLAIMPFDKKSTEDKKTVEVAQAVSVKDTKTSHTERTVSEAVNLQRKDQNESHLESPKGNSIKYIIIFIIMSVILYYLNKVKFKKLFKKQKLKSIFNNAKSSLMARKAK